jgi:hypothetical protein
MHKLITPRFALPTIVILTVLAIAIVAIALVTHTHAGFAWSYGAG